MTAENDLDRTLSAWFQADAMAAPPPEPLARVLASTRGIQPRPAMVAGLGSGWVGARSSNGTRGGVAGPRPHAFRLVGPALLVALLAAALVGTLVLLGSRLVTPQPPLGGVLAVAYADRLEFADADGSNPKVVRDDGPFFDPRWSLDGSYVAVRDADVGTLGTVHILRADGTEVGRVDTALSVHWSPYDDDRLLVRVGERGLHMIEADGTLVHDFGQPSGPGVLDTFAWAGTDTVHMHFSDGTGSMDRMTGEGGGFVGGGSVAFPSPFSDLNPTVLLLTDSNPSVRLREDSGFRLTRDVFGWADCSTTGSACQGRALFNLGYQPARIVAQDVELPTCVSDAVSRDGSVVLFERIVDGDRSIFRTGDDGIGEKRLTADSSSDRCPRWSSDGRRITFLRSSSAGFDAWVMDPDGANQIEVARGVSGVDLQPIQHKDPLRSEFVPGPTLGGVTGEYVPGVGLADGRALLVACPALVIDPSAATPIEVGPPLSCHHGAAIATLLDGRVLIAGGGSVDEGRIAEIFDPASNTFTSTGPLVEGLFEARATTLLDGRVLISGGTLNDPDGGYAIARAEIFDPATGTFTSTGSMLHPRSSHTATLLPDGRVLVTGGDGGEAPYRDAETWDPATGRFTATGPMNSGRQGGTATPLPDGTVLLTGGYGSIDPSGGVVLLATAEIFDPRTNTFHVTSRMRVPRWLHVAAPLPDGRVLIAGGTTEPGGSAATWSGNGMADAEVFDPATGQFTSIAPMLHPRMHAIAIPLSDGRVLIAGHWDGAVQSLSVNPAGPTTEVFE